MPSSQEPPEGSGIRSGEWLLIGAVLAFAGSSIKNRLFPKSPSVPAQTSIQSTTEPPLSDSPHHTSHLPPPPNPAAPTAHDTETKKPAQEDDAALVAELKQQGFEPVLDSQGRLIRDPSTKAPLVRPVAKATEEKSKATATAATSSSSKNLSDAEHRLLERLKASGLTKTAASYEAAKAAATPTSKTVDKASNEVNKKQVRTPSSTNDSPRSNDGGWDNFGVSDSAKSNRPIPSSKPDPIVRRDVKVNGESVPIYTCSTELTPVSPNGDGTGI